MTSWCCTTTCSAAPRLPRSIRITQRRCRRSPSGWCAPTRTTACGTITAGSHARSIVGWHGVDTPPAHRRAQRRRHPSPRRVRAPVEPRRCRHLRQPLPAAPGRRLRRRPLAPLHAPDPGARRGPHLGRVGPLRRPRRVQPAAAAIVASGTPAARAPPQMLSHVSAGRVMPLAMRCWRRSCSTSPGSFTPWAGSIAAAS